MDITGIETSLKMFEKLISDTLNSLLGKFIENVDAG
jgi:hypothetical protein